MRLSRNNREGIELTNGPAKLCQALQIDRRLNGHDLTNAPLQLILRPTLPPEQIVQAPRIGISREVRRPWRFYIAENAFVSHR
jgi:DNA-3-methyladenine glycosylase